MGILVQVPNWYGVNYRIGPEYFFSLMTIFCIEKSIQIQGPDNIIANNLVGPTFFTHATNRLIIHATNHVGPTLFIHATTQSSIVATTPWDPHTLPMQQLNPLSLPQLYGTHTLHPCNYSMLYRCHYSMLYRCNNSLHQICSMGTCCMGAPLQQVFQKLLHE